MNDARDEAPTRLPVFDPEATGFAGLMERWERSAVDGCRLLARYAREGNVQFIVDPSDALPLPSRLDTPEILSECRKMEREHFPETEGAALYDYLAGEGFTILSWPDRTKVAVKPAGESPTATEARMAYAAARFNREAYLQQLAGQGGEPCSIH